MDELPTYIDECNIVGSLFAVDVEKGYKDKDSLKIFHDRIQYCPK
jgi:hypothetical protein